MTSEEWINHIYGVKIVDWNEIQPPIYVNGKPVRRISELQAVFAEYLDRAEAEQQARKSRWTRFLFWWAGA